MVEDNREIKIAKRIFCIWQDEKEEAWLSDMAAKGWHLVNIPKVSRYKFAKGSPKKVRYCLDYQNISNKDENYKSVFKDAGWEYILSMAGWQYFRKEYTRDEMPEIFSDNDSKLQKYYRVLTLWGILIFPLCILPIFSSIFIISAAKVNVSDLLKVFLIGAHLILISLFVFIISKIMARIKKIKNNSCFR